MASTLPMGGENAPSVRYTTREEAAEAVRAARTNAGRFQLEYVGEASRHAEEMRGTTEDWIEEVSERLHALGERQWRFHEEVAASRTLLEEELGRAREASRHGAKMAKEAVMRCLHRCETLRAGLLNDVRELAASTSGEGMQLSRRFHRSWTAVTECGERAFQYLVDFDRFVAQEATRVDATALLTLVEDCLGSAGGMISPEESKRLVETYELECVLLCASRLSILSKDASPREPTRVGDLPPVTPVAASPAAATPTKTPPTPTKTGVPPRAERRPSPRRRPRRLRRRRRRRDARAKKFANPPPTSSPRTSAVSLPPDSIPRTRSPSSTTPSPRSSKTRATTRRTRAVPTVHRPSTNPRDYPRRELSRTPATVAP